MKYDTKEILQVYNTNLNYSKTAGILGIDARTVKRHVNKVHLEDSFAASESSRTGIPFDRVGHYWLKTKNENGDDVSLFVKNNQEVMDYDELRDKLIEDLKAYAPNPVPLKRDNNKENLLVVDPADIHIGKLAIVEETGDKKYDIEIAYKRVLTGVVDIINKAKNFGLEHIVVVVGNDILHIDTPRRTTTSGTPQDTDGQWWEMFVSARNLYVEIIETAKQVANVTVVYCPSNHDYMMGFGLIDSLYSWYRQDSNVVISHYGKSIRHRKYVKYGNNLIGFTHGDGAKNKDLSNLMQYEAKQMWADCKFAYWYVHHMHHKYRQVNNIDIEKDHIGITVIGTYGDIGEHNTCIECVRSPSPADSWHSRNGYINTQAIEGFIHNVHDGQIARITSYC